MSFFPNPHGTLIVIFYLFIYLFFSVVVGVKGCHDCIIVFLEHTTKVGLAGLGLKILYIVKL